MENLKRVIERYIQTKNTFYALLINGDWGCGKTFFIKANYFKNKPKQDTWIVSRIFSWIGAMLIDKKNKEQPYQFCYISLNGLTKTDDIMAQFTAELLSARDWKKKFGVGDGDKQTNHFLNRLASGVTKNAKSIFDKTLDKVGFKFENIIEFFERKNCVIFIDDLERCKLPIEETLGYINTHFVEHAGLKIIFLANEREITSHDKNQTYQTIKEKIIGRTIEFEATLEENLISILGQYSDELQHFVKKYKDVIINVISLAEPDKKHNLRTLQFAFGMFEPLLKLMNECGAGVPIVNNDSIHEMIIEYFLCVCYAHKAGKKIKDELKKKKDEFDKIIDSAFGKKNKQMATATNVMPDKPTELAEIFKIISNIRYEYIALDDTLDDYIERGYWNESDFTKVLNDLINDFQSEENLIKIDTLFDKFEYFEFDCFLNFKNDLEQLVDLLINNNKSYDKVLKFFSVVITYKTLINKIKPNYANELIPHFVDTAKHYKYGPMTTIYLNRFREKDEELAPYFDEIIAAIEGEKTPPSLPVTENWFDISVEDLKTAWQQSYTKEQIQAFSILVIKSIRHSYKSFDSIEQRIDSCANPEIIEQLLYDLEHSSKVETDELIRYKLQKTINLLSVKLRNTERK